MEPLPFIVVVVSVTVTQCPPGEILKEFLQVVRLLQF